MATQKTPPAPKAKARIEMATETVSLRSYGVIPSPHTLRAASCPRRILPVACLLIC